jgi:hypothetical protein
LVKEVLNNSKIDLSIGNQLIHGDIIEKSKDIPDESIDLIFADPPHDKEHLYLYGELAKVAQRVLKNGGSLLTVVGHYAIFQINDLINNNSTGLNFSWPLVILHAASTRAQHEPKVLVGYKPLLWYVKGDKRDDTGKYIVDVIRSKATDKTGNDWAQSTVEAEEIISKLTVENQIVFDPMMGSLASEF